MIKIIILSLYYSVNVNQLIRKRREKNYEILFPEKKNIIQHEFLIFIIQLQIIIIMNMKIMMMIKGRMYKVINCENLVYWRSNNLHSFSNYFHVIIMKIIWKRKEKIFFSINNLISFMNLIIIGRFKSTIIWLT